MRNTPTTQDRTERLTFILFLFIVIHWNKCDQLLYGLLDVGVLRSLVASRVFVFAVILVRNSYSPDLVITWVNHRDYSYFPFSTYNMSVLDDHDITHSNVSPIYVPFLSNYQSGKVVPGPPFPKALRYMLYVVKLKLFGSPLPEWSLGNIWG